MRLIEIIGAGFDGGTDATDDRILWVRMPDDMSLNLHEVGACIGNDLPKHLVHPDAIDFTLPEHMEAFWARLRQFQTGDQR